MYNAAWLLLKLFSVQKCPKPSRYLRPNSKESVRKEIGTTESPLNILNPSANGILSLHKGEGLVPKPPRAGFLNSP